MNMEVDEISNGSGTIWKRGLYMLLFAFLLGIAKFVTFAVVMLQFVLIVLNNTPNAHLLVFGKSLSRYTYQVMIFLTFNSEEQPYPFSEWPSENSTVK